MTSRSRRRALGKLAAATTLILGTVGTMVPAVAAAGPEAAPQVTPVAWGPCAPAEISNVPPEEQAKFSCATFVVPLDYDHPRRGSINLAMMRRTANDQANRIGSLRTSNAASGTPQR